MIEPTQLDLNSNQLSLT